MIILDYEVAGCLEDMMVEMGLIVRKTGGEEAF